VLGVESSCDETGVALYHTGRGLLAHALHTQAAMHAEYGGVVPELASRDHIRRVVPLTRRVLADAGVGLDAVDAIAYTRGPGLAGALLVGAAFAEGLALALGKPLVAVHHLEGHLLSPLLCAEPPQFPFVALLVSGGHSQLMQVEGLGRYVLLGESLDDATGEAFDKTAKLLGLGYPGGPALARLAEQGTPGRFRLPRPMLDSGDLDMSFSGLKTAVVTALAALHAGGDAGEVGQRGVAPRRDDPARPQWTPTEQARADLAAEFEAAVADVLVAKSMAAVAQCGLRRLVVAGGVGANRRLRERLGAAAARQKVGLYFPELQFCTDNGAMISLAGALRLKHGGGVAAAMATGAAGNAPAVSVRPRWPLAELAPPG
jgi:N6-L-threonylcarbamoyladenine synthase